MSYGKICRDACRAAYAGGDEHDELHLNPFKNHLAEAWNAAHWAEVWKEVFLDECLEITLAEAAGASDDAYHS